MKEVLITFPVAKLAKEKGFQEYTQYFYTEENGLCEIEYDYDYSKLWIYDENLKIKDTFIDWSNEDEFWYNDEKEEFYIPEKYPALTQSLLQRWLREIHNISIEVFSLSYHNKIQFTMNIKKLKESEIKILSKNNYHFKTYEEALEIGLQKALKLIK